MLNNKKGLSAIVATLMIILLVLIAVGIIWVVVKNVVDSGAEDIEKGAKCMGVDLSITSAKLNAGYYEVVVERGADDEELAGVKLIFSNADGKSYDSDEIGNIEALGSQPYSIAVTSVKDADMVVFMPRDVEIAAYFTGSAGSEYCDKIDSYAITGLPA